jgi:hypothetical protein
VKGEIKMDWMNILKTKQIVTPTTDVNIKKIPKKSKKEDCCQKVKDFLNSEWRIPSTNPLAKEGWTKIDAEAFTSSVVNAEHNPLFNITAKNNWNDLDCEEVYILIVAGYNYERMLGNKYTMEMGKYMEKRCSKAITLWNECNNFGEISWSLRQELSSPVGDHMFNRARYVLNKWGI